MITASVLLTARIVGLHIIVSESSRSRPLLLWPHLSGLVATLMRRPASGPDPTSTAKTRECFPFAVVYASSRNDNPCKGADQVDACTWDIHDRGFEVWTDFNRTAGSCGDAFEPGWDELAISISNSAVAQVILQGISKFIGFRVPVLAAVEALDARFGNPPPEAVDTAFCK
jgi:hypothetical protein